MLSSSLILSALVAPIMAQYASRTTFTFPGNTIPTGLTISEYPVYEDKVANGQGPKYDRIFERKNVVVRNGFMELRVPGGQTKNPISCAEVGTTFEVQYGSIKTFAILAEEPGVCNGETLRSIQGRGT